MLHNGLVMKKLCLRLVDNKYPFLTILIILLFFPLAVKNVFAVTAPTSGNTLPDIGGGSWYVQSPNNWNQKVFQSSQGEMFKERYSLSILTDMMNSTLTATMGAPILIAEGPNGPVYAYRGGAIELLAGISSSLYNNSPASSIEYLADIGQNVGLAKPAYAQGLGFSVFSPVLSLWKTFRDVAYLGFVVIFVIIGFMVMFRRKIDPRTVVTIQDALPRIVIALILVTFSYAILGLMIDIMQLASNILIKLVASGLPNSEIDKLMNNNIFNLVPPIGRSVVDFAGAVFSNIQINFGSGFVGEAALKVLGWISVAVVFGIASFFIMFKIFFMLLGSYINIILSIIFAPIQLMMAALPGNNTTVTSWLRGALANIVVFPATLIMLLIAYTFLAGTGVNLSQYTEIAGLVPSLTPTSPLTWAPPLIGAKWGREIGFFIAFGILFSIPSVAEAIKQAFEIKPSPLAGAAEKEMKGGISWIPIIGGIAGRSL